MYQGSASHEQVSHDEVEVSTLRRNARCCIDMRVTVVYASGMHKRSSVRLRRNSVEKMVNFPQSILLIQPIERMLEKIQDLGNAAEILHKHPLFVVRTVWESW